MTIGTEGVKSVVRATVARALAEALITGIDNAQAEGHALSQLQQIDIAVMSMMAAHSAIAQAEECIAIESRLLSEFKREAS